jgi:signal peptidase I
MNFNFELILMAATVATGLIVLADRLWWRATRNPAQKEPILVDYSRAFFPVLLIVLLLRSFLVEPFQIPSGSMEPTLRIGDFVVVNKYTYGIRLPLWRTKILDINEPQRGDVFVFRYPVNPSVNFIKRVVGLPGDTITYKDKTLFINDKEVPKVRQGDDVFVNEFGQSLSVERWLETLNGVQHISFQRSDESAPTLTWVVPAHHYFAMGDNRDSSDDSRYWGFVPEENIVGKAFMVWMSIDWQAHRVRWDRLGTRINAPLPAQSKQATV